MGSLVHRFFAGAAVVNALPTWAGDYVGIPWQPGGRSRNAVDCYGLVRLVLEDRGGIRLPVFDTVGATDLMRVYDEIEANVNDWRVVPAGKEQPFDVVRLNRAFKHNGRFVVRPVHMGVVIGGGRLLHAEPDGAAGVILSEIDSLRSRIDAILRHSTMCSGLEGPAGSPFDCHRMTVEPGLYLSDMIELAGIDEATLTFAEVWIGATRVEREWWPRVKPKAGAKIWIVVVPQGGGGLRIAAMIGVIALATAATILLPGIGGALLGSAIMGGGMFAINKFLPPPVQKPPSYSDSKASAVYSLSGGTNQRRPGGPVPVLLGRHKFIPPSTGQYTEQRGQKQVLHAIFDLSSGPITDPNIFIGDTPLSEFAGVKIKFERGWHPKQLRDRGSWNPNAGFPKNTDALPGDKWTASRDAGQYKKNDFIVFNGLGPLNSTSSWDLNPGRGSDIFPSDVTQEPLSVELKYKEPQIRTSAVGADRIGVDFRSPSLGQVNSKGRNENYSIDLQIYESPVEQPDAWRLVIGKLRMTAGAGGAKETFGSHSWVTAGNSPSKQYNVRVKRISPVNNTVDNTVWSEVSWAAIKTYTNTNPVPDAGVSRLYMEVQASGQLSGTLQNVSCIAQTLAWRYEASKKKWTWGPTSNPAALARLVYQMPHYPDPLTNDQIDFPKFEEASDFCDRNSLEYNAYIDFKVANLNDFLGDIGITGFFAICRRNGKRSVALDPVEGEPQPVRVFVDGVNCWNSSTKDMLTEKVHAVRINISDQTKDWTPSERLIYNDGYNSTNSTKIVDRTFIGITTSAQATLLGRMAIAEETLRREVTETITGIGGLSCNVGDVVAFASDDLAIGTARGRIASVILGDDNTTVLGVTVTTPVHMEDREAYGICYSVGGKTTTIAVMTEPGEQTMLRFVQPPAHTNRPEPDAVFSFGPREREVMPLVIRDVNPDDEENVRLTLIGLPPTLTELRTNLPEWDSRATLATKLPTPIVTSVLSSAREMILTAQRDLVTQVIINLAPISVANVQVITMMRPSGVTDDFTVVQSTNYGNGRIGILGCEDGNSYDFRVRYTHTDYFTSDTTEILRHRVVGRVDPPEAVANLQLVIISRTAARLHWEEPAELDVRFGGRLIIRHSPEKFSASWERSSRLLATDVSAALLTMNVPLMEGTYMIMTQDSSGNLSREFASVSTDAATIDQFDVLTDGVLAEEPLFVGQKFNCVVSNGALRLTQGDFDSVADVDSMPSWDAIGLNVVNSGIYLFADPYYDMGEIRRVRIHRHIAQSGEMIGDLISKRMLPVSQWPSVSGTVGAPVDCIVEIQSTSGDPALPDTIWSPWTRLDVGEWVCRAIRSRAILYTEDGAYGIAVSQLQVIVEEMV